MHWGRIEEQASLHGTYLLAELYLCSHGTYLLAELYLQWRRSCQAILDTIAHGVHVCKQREKTKLMCTQGKVAATGINIINNINIKCNIASANMLMCVLFLAFIIVCVTWQSARANRVLPTDRCIWRSSLYFNAFAYSLSTFALYSAVSTATASAW